MTHGNTAAFAARLSLLRFHLEASIFPPPSHSYLRCRRPCHRRPCSRTAPPLRSLSTSDFQHVKGSRGRAHRHSSCRLLGRLGSPIAEPCCGRIRQGRRSRCFACGFPRYLPILASRGDEQEVVGEDRAAHGQGGRAVGSGRRSLHRHDIRHAGGPRRA